MTDTTNRFPVKSHERRFNPRQWQGLAAAFALPVLLAAASTFSPSTARSAAPVPDPGLKLEHEFNTAVRPFLSTYCAPCHSKTNPDAQLDLTSYANLAAVMGDDAHWTRVLDKLASSQMPPSTADKQPGAAEREAVVNWIRTVRAYETLHRKDTGDPGPILARRLSNSEYDYTIRDLTGVDLHPTREFPVDPADQEGFDNSGESLTLSGALMKKYVQAAKDIADHMVLTSTGLQFATHPVLAETDRDKYCILRIVDFYKHQPTDIADYFEAAWRFRYRAALGGAQTTLPAVAERAHLSPRYLTLIWEMLDSAQAPVGPVSKLQGMWNALPPADPAHLEAARSGCLAMRDWAQGFRKKVAWKFSNLPVPRGFSSGGQCFVLWKDREYASHRREFDPSRLSPDAADPDLHIPTDTSDRAAYLTSITKFCDVFPDAFYISERGRMFVDDPGDQGRLLTAGLHNSLGYFRDDTPLMDLILDDAGRQKLDHMWRDFDMVAFVPERMHSEFFVYERAESGTITDPEFNFARAEDKDALSDPNIKKLAGLYLAKARRNGAQPKTLAAIDEHFKRVSVNIRTAERERLAAEPLHRQALLDFAGRAYRRPLTPAERDDLIAFYQELRQKDGLSHEDAIRDSVARILLSPDFLFRLDLEAPPLANSVHLAAVRRHSRSRVPSRPAASLPPPDAGVQPLSDYDLASRLSYFLWSSMPDAELMAHAAAGDLHRPEVLAAQARRMMQDPRVRALAVEFGGNWLDFRRFEEHQAVDRDRFPTFTNALREAMFEEPVRFLTDTFQNDRSVLNMVYGKYTFVNADLARHYEMTDVKATETSWVRVDNADKYGRGGLLPMGVFLTKNSPGLRTSPVKRGYWVVKRVLGEYIPPPPATVPELPKDESKMGDLTLRMALARHRQDPACAGCHARFDSYGLVFEGFDPIGQRRLRDLGGKPVDAKAPFPGGPDREGVAGLQSFIGEKRQKDFVDTLDRKLYSYALGRSLQPSDDPALTRISQKMTATNYRFETLVEGIVASRQFRYRRSSAALPANPPAALAAATRK